VTALQLPTGAYEIRISRNLLTHTWSRRRLLEYRISRSSKAHLASYATSGEKLVKYRNDSLQLFITMYARKIVGSTVCDW